LERAGLSVEQPSRLSKIELNNEGEKINLIGCRVLIIYLIVVLNRGGKFNIDSFLNESRDGRVPNREHSKKHYSDSVRSKDYEYLAHFNPASHTAAARWTPVEKGSTITMAPLLRAVGAGDLEPIKLCDFSSIFPRPFSNLAHEELSQRALAVSFSPVSAFKELARR
jgi:hypothetical protein